MPAWFPVLVTSWHDLLTTVTAPSIAASQPAHKKSPVPFQKGLRNRWIVSSSRSAPGGSPVPAPGAWPLIVRSWRGEEEGGVPNPSWVPIQGSFGGFPLEGFC
jgi:hypothetical protein